MNVISLLFFIVDLASTLANQVAYVMMKRALLSVENTGLNGTKKRSPYCSKMYIGGFVLLVVGSLVHVAALPFCDVVLLSTNIATGILFSSILAIKYLGERPVWKYDGPSLALIVAGCLAIVLLSSYEDQKFTVAIIEELLARPSTIVFFSFFILISVATYSLWSWFFKAAERFNNEANTWLQAHKLGCPSLNDQDPLSIDLEEEEDRSLHTGISYGINAEIDTSLSILTRRRSLSQSGRRSRSLLAEQVREPSSESEPVQKVTVPTGNSSESEQFRIWAAQANIIYMSNIAGKRAVYDSVDGC